MMWISFELAAEEVERRLGVSWGKAQKVLLEACKNKEVKSQRTECGPDVLDTEFRAWLKEKQGRKANTSSRKRDLAKQAINHLWSNGIPKDLPRKQIVKEADNWIKDYCKRKSISKLIISDDTILRAAGRKGN
jgi:hypothetical protein